jgi:hypothetical protein
MTLVHKITLYVQACFLVVVVGVVFLSGKYGIKFKLRITYRKAGNP